MKLRLLLLLVLGVVCAPFSAPRAATLYTESVQGDLSNYRSTPTSLSVAPGSNQFFGTTGRDLLTGVDRDYLTFVVPVGYVWSAFVLLPGTVEGGSVSFAGVEAGNQITVLPSAGDATGLLGWTHYGGAGSENTDLLPAMGSAGFGSTGFTPPLPAGTYSLWIQDINTGTFPYGFDIQITPVPEPEIAALALVVFLAEILRRSVRSRRILGR